MKKILLSVLIVAFSLACQKEERIGVIKLDALYDNVIELPAEAGSMNVMLECNTQWRIEFPSSVATWFSTDLHGGKPERRYFTVTHTANASMSPRTCSLKIYTTDGNDSKVIRFRQLPSKDYITLSEQTVVAMTPGEYAVDFLTSLVSVTEIVASTDVDWIGLKEMAEGDTSVVFTVAPMPSVKKEPRTGSIYLSYTDGNARICGDTLLVRQLSTNFENAELISISRAKEILSRGGLIEDNVYVEGNVTAYGNAVNYKASIHEPCISGYRYIIQDSEGNAVVFESGQNLSMKRNALVQIRLQGLKTRNYKDGGFSYSVFSQLEPGHVVSSKDAPFTPPVKKISELTYSDVFSLVQLSGVEIAPIDGAYTNFKETSPVKITSSSAPKSSAYTLHYSYRGGYIDWMKSYPHYFRFYPTPLIDSDGNVMYLHVSPTDPQCHTSYPQGRGTVTGLVVREGLSNFDLSSSVLGIRPLDCGTDVVLDGAASDVLVNFEFHHKNGSIPDRNYIREIEGQDRWLPTRKSAANDRCTFSKVGSIKIAATYSGPTQLGFQDKFRGDEKVEQSDGNNFRMSGITTQVLANTTATFLLDSLCTQGCTGQLYLVIETNADRSLAANPVRARIHYSVSGTDEWTEVPDSEIKFLSQFDRAGSTESNYRESVHVPGMKMFAVPLPKEMNGQEWVSLKVEQVMPQTSTKTLRIGSVTVKCLN